MNACWRKGSSSDLPLSLSKSLGGSTASDFWLLFLCLCAFETCPSSDRLFGKGPASHSAHQNSFTFSLSAVKRLKNKSLNCQIASECMKQMRKLVIVSLTFRMVGSCMARNQ